ncbi:MAG: hypothetical protein ACKV2Q_06855 [Planctomycetaceae bacterium]
MTVAVLHDFSWQRMINAVEAVDRRQAHCVAAFLIRMKLTAFRTVDRVHLDDLLSVQLFDPSWTDRFPPEFASRLAAVFDVHEVWPDDYVEALTAAGFQSDEELVEFQTICRESGDQRLDTLPWFLAREKAHEKVRIA